MSPLSDTDVELRRKRIANNILTCAAWVCEGWAMEVLWHAIESVQGLRLGWGMAALALLPYCCSFALLTQTQVVSSVRATGLSSSPWVRSLPTLCRAGTAA